MKKTISDADKALLLARGKVTSLTTSRDFEIPSFNKKEKKVKKVKSDNPLVGKILHASWGYNMTINEYCKIIEVSPTGKTVVCRMVNVVSVDPGATSFAGRVRAGGNTKGPKFRLKYNPEGWNGNPTFHGSFPFIIGDTKEESSYQMGYFSVDGGGVAYENHMD